jgi:hypothetical protein
MGFPTSSNFFKAFLENKKKIYKHGIFFYYFALSKLYFWKKILGNII